MADEHAAVAPESPMRPHLTKQTLASREGRNIAAPPIAPSRLDTNPASSPFSSFDDGSGSSSSKPHFSFRDVTSPSTVSKTQSPDTELETPPKLVQSPRPAYFPFVDPDTGSSTPASLLSGELSEPAQIPASSPSGTDESEDYGGPTRASIRAWAKATPAGAPTSLSARSTPELPQSGSDDNLNRVSLTRTMHDFPVSADSSVKHTSSRSSNIGPRMSLNREESSGNVADGESSGSEQNSSSPPSGSPPLDARKLAAQRELTAPHPHPRPVSPPLPSKHVTHALSAHPRVHSHPHAHPHGHFHPHAHSRAPPHSRTSPDSSLPALAPASATAPTHPDQQERAERRHRHHRRRHRDRERDRERDRDRRTRHPPGHGVVSVPALPPLRPLRPPPPPLPLRTLPAMPLGPISAPYSPVSNASSRPKTDLFREIERMLRTARKPILRAHHEMDENENSAGWAPFPTDTREAGPGGSPGVRHHNDVLEDIRTMIQWSCR